MPLILASSSRYRQELLSRLQVPFKWHSPAINETPLPNESITDTALRLACEKARVVSHLYPGQLIIGSDQVASYNNELVCKPGNHENARSQLLKFSGRIIHFFSAVCVHNGSLNTVTRAAVCTEVHFRTLTGDEIEH